MNAMKIGLMSLVVLAAAALGNSRKDLVFVSVDANTIENKAAVPLEPKAVVTNTTGGLRSTMTITIPGEGKSLTFSGRIGLYDQATFKKANGSPSDQDSLEVISLDQTAGTLVAIHYGDASDESVGYAYVFKRKNASSEYRLAWHSGGMTSTRAVDVDTYMQENRVGLDVALVALTRDASELRSQPRKAVAIFN